MSFKLVRCEKCGAKAHVAASQCPKCGHMLELRDSLGKPMPLSHCRGCDTYHRRDRGPCRFCVGEAAPPPRRVAPFVWSGAAGLMLVGMGWGIWTLRGHEVLSLPAPSVALATVDTVGTLIPAPTTTDSLPVTEVTLPAATTPAPETVPAPTNVAPPDRSVGEVRISQAVMTRGSAHWVVATARTWANVRSDADRGSNVVGIITPETRVQLGETRGGWHRLRSGRIEGWVDHRLFAMESQSIAR